MIHQITLQDCLEPTAPPGRLLTIGALDDTVFVRICDVETDAHHETQTEIAEISVSLPSLLEALALLGADQDRENLRPLDHVNDGSKETRIAGARFTAVPAGVTSAVLARQLHVRYTPLPKQVPADAAEEARIP